MASARKNRVNVNRVAPFRPSTSVLIAACRHDLGDGVSLAPSF